MNIISRLEHIITRRRALTSVFDTERDFALLEESCVPSYCHPNFLVAYAAWWRLFAATAIAKRLTSPGSVLDFGAGSGELRHLLDDGEAYTAIEADGALHTTLRRLVPDAQIYQNAEELGPSCFDTVFALDSLEHNENPGELLRRLERLLTPSGILVLSGPTENSLYRLGRRIAGFDGHYHQTDITAINQLAAERLRTVARLQGPFCLPLFVVSAWRRA